MTGQVPVSQQIKTVLKNARPENHGTLVYRTKLLSSCNIVCIWKHACCKPNV